MTAWNNRTGSSAKMGNSKVSLDGHSFSSKLEAAVYQILKLRLKAGEIEAIQCQDHVYLSDARIGYVPDFKCIKKDGAALWVEAKGFANDRWPILKKLWRFYGPGQLEIWKGSYLKPFLDEVVNPENTRKMEVTIAAGARVNSETVKE